MLKILEPQPLATAVAYKKTVYRCNCQVNYTLFYNDKLCQNKQAETAKNKKGIKKTFRAGSLNKESFTSLLKICLQKGDLAYTHCNTSVSLRP